MSDYDELFEDEVEEVETEETEVEEAEELEDDTPIEDGEDADDTPDINKQFLQQFKIKYDGEEVGYESLDDLIKDAQQGRNYDRIVKQRDSYKENPAYKYIDQLMKDRNYEDPMSFVRDIQINDKVAELTEMGLTEEDAKRVAEEFVGKQTESSKQDKEIDGFIDWHASKYDAPLAVDDIPQEVIDAYKGGQPLKEAYLEYKLDNTKYETQQETIKKLAENKQKSAGKLPGEKQPNDNKNMTVAQIDKLMKGMSKSQQSKWADDNWKVLEKSGYFD